MKFNFAVIWMWINQILIIYRAISTELGMLVTLNYFHNR